MAKKFIAGLATGLFVAGMVGFATANVTINFDEHPIESSRITNDYINNGITFSDNWIYYNARPEYGYTAHSGTFTAALQPTYFPESEGEDLVQYDFEAKITFTEEVSEVSAYFNVYGGEFTWTAFNSLGIGVASATVLQQQQTGSSPMVQYFLLSQSIKCIVLTGDVNVVNSFNMDDLSFNQASTSPVPVPSSLLLFGTSLVGLIGSRLRRQK